MRGPRRRRIVKMRASRPPQAPHLPSRRRSRPPRLQRATRGPAQRTLEEPRRRALETPPPTATWRGCSRAPYPNRPGHFRGTRNCGGRFEPSQAFRRNERGTNDYASRASPTLAHMSRDTRTALDWLGEFVLPSAARDKVKRRMTGNMLGIYMFQTILWEHVPRRRVPASGGAGVAAQSREARRERRGTGLRKPQKRLCS